MDVLRAADEPHTAHTKSPEVDVFLGGFCHFGMRRKSEVVVGTEIQYRRTVHDDLGALLAGDDAFLFDETGSVDIL